MEQNKYTTEDLINAVSKKDATVISKYDMDNFKKVLSSLTPDEIRGDGAEWTPLMHASGEGNVEMVKLLLPHYSLEEIARENGESTALIHAVKYRGNPEVIRLLLDAGLTPEHITMEDEEGSTALSYALENGYDEIVGMLLPHLTPEQIWKKAVEEDGSYVSYILSSSLFETMFDFITPSLLNKCGFFLLKISVIDHSVEEVKNVLKYLPKENIREIAGNALECVGSPDENDKMELLLSLIPDEQSKVNNTKAAEALIESIGPNSKRVEMLLRRLSPEEMNVPSESILGRGQTAFMKAVRYDFRKCIELLLPHLSIEQIQAKDQNGKTAKDLARFPSVKEMIQKRLDELQLQETLND